MKYLVILLIFCLSSCYYKNSDTKATFPVNSIKNCDSIIRLKDSSQAILKRKCDSLNLNLGLYKFRLLELNKYVNIVVNNHSQIIFLKGWAARANQ